MYTTNFVNVSKRKTLLPVYFPWLLSTAFAFNPLNSYLIAWFGSLMIFYWTLISPIKYLNHDLPLTKQVMRPIVFLQLIFAGFMCSTSIFYFLDHIGYQYFTLKNNQIFIPNDITDSIARCQRYCLLAHAALVTGIIVVTKQGQKIKYHFKVDPARLLIQVCIGTYVLAMVTSRISAIVQFSYMLLYISLFTAAVGFVKGMITKKTNLILFGGAVFTLNIIASTLTGYKESVINNVLILAFLLYPHYKKFILVSAIPVFAVLLFALPTISAAVRTQAWSGETSAEQAREEAYETLLNDDNIEDIQETNWQFLIGRLSEINMFTQFVDYVPNKHSYYGLEIFKNALIGLVPRFIWSGKPNMETLSMERVYDANVANRLSPVSAKTRPVVDGYLSGGLIGILLSMFIYGALAQWLCNKAESLFGGYEMGCIVVFNGIFQQMWRGNNWEFLLNNIFYGFVLLMILYLILKTQRILVATHPCE